MNEKIIRYKKNIVGLLIVAIFILIVIIGFKVYQNRTGFGLSEDNKIAKINDLVIDKKYDEANNLNYVYFKDDEEKYDDIDDKIYECQYKGLSNFEEVDIKREKEKQLKTQKVQKEPKMIEVKPKAEIVDFTIEGTDATNSYINVKPVIKNIGNIDINYVKVNIYELDDNNNIVNSYWTNDNACIKPNATQTLSKMIKNSNPPKRYSVELAEYHN